MDNTTTDNTEPAKQETWVEARNRQQAPWWEAEGIDRIEVFKRALEKLKDTQTPWASYFRNWKLPW